MTILRRGVLLGAMLGLACVTTPSGGGTVAESGWDALSSRFLEWTFRTHPGRAVNAGRHEFDGQVGDFSRAALEKQAADLHAWRTELEAVNAAELPPIKRLEREVLQAAVDRELFALEDARAPFRNPTVYGYGLSPSIYVTRPYAPLDVRAKAFAAHARQVPRVVKQAMENLETPMPRSFVAIGRLTIGGMAKYYVEDAQAAFAGVSDPALKAEVKAAGEAASAAAKEMDAWFAAQEKTATNDFALGAERYQRMLHAVERVDLPLDQLEAIGRKDLDRNLAALKEACAQAAPGASLDDCVKQVEAKKPAEGPVEAARKQLDGLEKFIRDRGVVTIPSDERAHVDEAPAFRRWNFAYIEIPGPYEHGLPSIYYIAPPDPKWSEADRASYLPGQSVLLFTTAHEVWPGHFLQFLHAHKAPSRVLQLFSTGGFTEGWAHYTEELMWEVGLGEGDPATHVGQLTDALLRNCRYLSAIGMHARGMSMEASEKLFREQCFQNPGSARQQAARGTFDPGYLNYTMGKLMIRKLREDWTKTRGGKAAWKDFNDTFLSYGAPPVPLVRKMMMGEVGDVL
jgi:uncharacterized protein (DUF885 family)